MKENVDKYIDDLARRVIKEGGIESPAFNFTDMVMSNVEGLNKSDVTQYKPLISKTTWVLIFIGFLALVLYIMLFSDQTETSGWLNKIEFNLLSNNKVVSVLSGFSISKSFTYAVLLLGLMICIQIPILKSYFDKRLQV